MLTLHGDSGRILTGWDFLVTTSTKESKNDAIPFKYYPNPATEQLNLAFEKSTSEPWVFSLYNSLGQKVFEYLITQSKGIVNEPIQFRQQFQAGHYFYVLQNENRRILSSGGLQMTH